jgi:hypothetical protein
MNATVSQPWYVVWTDGQGHARRDDFRDRETALNFASMTQGEASPFPAETTDDQSPF